MRGKGAVDDYWRIVVGITPAYAGKRNASRSARALRRDHPRVCGEKLLRHREERRAAGSPPRMRGKAILFCRAEWCIRITPAYAGKSYCASALCFACGDHPRVCGEKLVEKQITTHDGGITPAYAGKSRAKGTWPNIEKGSPPRMRGKGAFAVAFAPSIGITPAYAGKSSGCQNALTNVWDHPRVCGEKTKKIP